MSSEILDDERKETASAFWRRARRCYREQGIKHKFTKPYRPQTNGKIERFHRTLAAEWAYAEYYDSDAARAATYQAWIHHYNHHRPPRRHRRAHPITTCPQPPWEEHLDRTHRQRRDRQRRPATRRPPP